MSPASDTGEPGVNHEEEIWPALADLFFLDTEPQPEQFQSVARFLIERGYGRQEVERALIERVAPVAGANLGYLLYPIVTGEWAGFDPDLLCEEIGRWRRRRARLPGWCIWVTDRWCHRMLCQMRWERLLTLLPPHAALPDAEGLRP